MAGIVIISDFLPYQRGFGRIPFELVFGKGGLLTLFFHFADRHIVAGPVWLTGLMMLVALAAYVFGRAYDFITLEAGGVYGGVQQCLVAPISEGDSCDRCRPDHQPGVFGIAAPALL